MKGKRLDRSLLARGMVASRAEAQALIADGKVRLDGKIVRKPAQLCPLEARIVIGEGQRYVSRGGEKLAGALAAFQFSPHGMICADVGASAGGFTDCLLQAGAARVYAIDVGRGQLHPRLRQDERVIARENCNARHLTTLSEPIKLLVVDVSFISLSKLLPVMVNWLAVEAEILALIKPQFELGPGAVNRSGVVRKPEKRRAAILSVIAAARALGLRPRKLARSCLRGPAGNVEYFARLGWGCGEVRGDALLLRNLAADVSHPT